MVINTCTKTQKEGNCSSHNYFKICIYKIVLLIAVLNIVIAVPRETFRYFS